MTDLYRNDIFPERACDRCGQMYRGPAVYCSLKCAIADSGSPILEMWIVYDHPPDFPDVYIARKTLTFRPPGPEQLPTSEAVVGKTLDEVRAKLPPGLTPLHRMDGDLPVIVEVWIV
jgi:hypothetical protein